MCILQPEFGFKSQYSWGRKFLSKCDVHVLGKWQYIQHMSCEVLKSSVIGAVCHLGCDIAGGQIVMMFLMECSTSLDYLAKRWRR